MSEEKLVPKLRFNGFDDGWQDTTLNDIATFTKGKDISKNDISDEGIECVRYGELYTKYGELIYDIDSKTNLNKNELILSNKNDILIPCSGETAIDLATASCIQKENVAIGGDITIIQTNQYAPFITYYLNQKKNEIARFAQGVSIVHLYSKDFKALKMKIPSINEQKKIISLLEILTNKEQLLKQKYQYYQNFKKYLMQQIFAQKLRFANFEEDWSTKKLGEIVEFLDNKRIPLNEDERNNQKDIYPYYGASGIIDYVEDYIFDEELILIGEDGTIDVNLASGKYWVSNHAHVLRASEDINQRYLFEFLKTVHFEIYNTGTIQPKLNKETCKTIPIKIPKSLEEQKLIANCLSKAENKIEICQKQINMTNNFKKGLLQQMFV